MKNNETLEHIEENIQNLKNGIVLATMELHFKMFPNRHIFIDPNFQRYCINKHLASLKFFRKLKIYMTKNKMTEITKAEFLLFRDHYNEVNNTDHWEFVR